MRLGGLAAFVAHPMHVLLNGGLLLASVGVIAAIYDFGYGQRLRALITIPILTAAVVWLGWTRIMAVRSFLTDKPRVVPYFKGSVEGGVQSDTWRAFKRGFAVATSIKALDASASHYGVTPPSTFGFSDEPRHWWDPEEGLRTLDALIDGQSRSEELSQDLLAIRAALARAAEKHIQFAFLVRLGADALISPVEMDNRKGSFW